MAPAPGIIAVGDVHGELAALREVLAHAGLLGPGDSWCGGADTLVQTGDVIDRGPHSVEAYALLGRLQQRAAAAGGRVVRLVGNHELALLMGETYMADFRGVSDFQRTLVADVVAGRVQGAFAGQGYVFVHAGIRSEMREHLVQDAAGDDAPGAIARRINEILRRSVDTGAFTDRIFHVGMSRGGRHRVGGVFWADARGLMRSDESGNVPQVFGHTPQRDGIAMSSSQRRVNIDVGMHHFGHRGYLVVRDGKVQAVRVTP